MPIIITPITAKKCEKLKYDSNKKAKNYLRDGGGLYLEVLKTGRKVWRYEYRLLGKKTRITKPQDFGTEEGGLSQARIWREEQRQLLKQGLNPSQQAKKAKARNLAIQDCTFKSVANEWLEHNKDTWSPRHYQKAEGNLKRVLRPALDDLPISEITTEVILAALQVPEKQGKRETAHQARLFASQIFQRAKVRQLTKNNPTLDVRGPQGLKPVITVSRPHIEDPVELGELLRKIDCYEARDPSVIFALKILPLVFTRPGELRCATWKEFSFDRCQWDIPAERMKMRNPHVVPLARQTIDLLEELRLHSYHGPESLLFPTKSDRNKPISDAVLSKVIRSLGYTGRHVPHGFRHTANTLLTAQLRFPIEAIEMQLAHGPKDEMRKVYNKWKYFPERQEMMRFWAHYLMALKNGVTTDTKYEYVDDPGVCQ